MIEIADARSLIESALGYGGATHTFEDVVAAVEAGKAQFWPGPRSVVVSEIVQHPRQKLLHFWLAAGHLEELERMLPMLEQWGKEQGCTAVTLSGRKGWEGVSFLKAGGWKPKLVVMMKEL